MSAYNQGGFKRKFNSDMSGDRRGGYVKREETESIEELITKIALKRDDVTLEDIDRLLEKVRREMSTRKNTIICTLLESFSKKQSKIPIYTTIAGFLNSEDEFFGADLVESLALGLQDALKEARLDTSINYVVSLCDLVNVGVVQPSSALGMLETFLTHATEDSTSTLRIEWILRVILNGISFIGEYISKQQLYQDKFDQLFEDVIRCVRNRKCDYSKALKIWIKNDEFPQMESLEMLLESTLNLKKNNWRFECLNRPYLSNKSDFTSKGHKFVIENIPQIPYKYFCVPKIYFRAIEESECFDLKICSRNLPKFGDFNRYYISVIIDDILNDPDDYRRSLYLLKSIIRSEIFNMPYIVIETILIKLFNCDDISEYTIKYCSALSDLCRQMNEVFVPVVEQIIKNMIQSVKSMNVKYFHKFVNWFVCYVNNLNCDFSWKMFLEFFDCNPDQYQLIFFHSVVKKLYCLVDVEKNQILDKLVKQIELPSLEPVFDYQDKPEKVIVQALAGAIKDKKSDEEIIKDIELAIENSKINDAITPIFQTLLKGGSKTLTHTQTVINKYLAIIKHFIKEDTDYRFKLIQAIFSFWKNNHTRIRHSLDYMTQINILTPLDVSIWFLEQKISKSPRNLIYWDYVFNYILSLNCRIVRIRTQIILLSININEKSDSNIKMLKIEKKETKSERKEALHKICEKIVDFIIKNISDNQEVSEKSAGLTCMLQRFQQVLFENHDFFLKSQDLFISLIERCNNEEHIIEIIGRFQSLFV